MLLPAVMAERKNSMSRKLRPEPEGTAQTVRAAFDTVAISSRDSVRFYGYEKTLRSNRETMFVSNTGAREIGAIYFSISYFDTSGRLLHRARHRRHISIPAGETRRLDIPSWDKQFTFYYTGSPKPRVSAIPYTISISADTLLLTRQTAD